MDTADPTTEPPTRRDDAEPSLVVRFALAALTAAAGAVHLVMVPSHSQESMLDGILFLLAGWAQVGLAVAVLAWPRRPVLPAIAAVNLAAALAWVVDRTAGLPFGADAGTPESASTIDQMTTAFEVAAVVIAVAALVRPALGRVEPRLAPLAAVVPVGVLLATSVALTSPEAADHHADDPAAVAGSPVSAQAVAAANRCDLGFNPASYWREADTAGWDTVTGGTQAETAAAAAGAPVATSGGGGHHGAASAGADDHGAAPAAAPMAAAPAAPNEGRGSAELDRLLGLSSGAGGEGEEAALVLALADASDESYEQWLERLSGTGTHAGPQRWSAMADQEQCDTLTAELEQAREVAMAHPTAADAAAAGYSQVTGYVPGIAAHWMKFSAVDDEFHLEEPEMLLYDGDGEDATIVGLSYYLSTNEYTEPTQGFTGDSDRYHVHRGLCVSGGQVVGDSTTTEEECAARGGVKSNGGRNWMSHAWVVPGCESPWGVFSGNNPILDGALGEASGEDGGGCAGSGVRDRYDLDPGTIANTPTTVNGAVEQASG